jgi:hypothetical protein
LTTSSNRFKLNDFSEIHFVLTTYIDSTCFELNGSTCFEIDPFSEFNDFSEIQFVLKTSTSHVKGGVEQPTISKFVLTTSTRHAPSTIRHASTSTRLTSKKKKKMTQGWVVNGESPR